MDKIRWIWLIAVFLVSGAPLAAQNNAPTVELLRSPDEYSILYMSDLIEDPAQAPVIFQMRLSPAPTAPTPTLALTVSFIADIPDLDIRNARIFSIRTEPFVLKGPVTVTNRDLAEVSNQIMTENGETITLRATRENIESLPQSQRASLLSKVLSLTAIPAGVYRFQYTLTSEDGAFASPVSDELTFEFQPPTNVQLIAPADQTVVQTTHPIFQWESTGTSGQPEAVSGTARYEYGLRVSEYDPARHGSYAEALEDDANLPFPDNGEFQQIPVSTSYQYPLTGVKELEEGKQYVWQVRKYFQTSRGEEVIDSEIYTFTVGGVQSDPLQIALQSILGTDRYNRYFGAGGPLEGYRALPGNLRLNGRTLSTTELMKLATGFNTGTYQLQNSTVEE